MVYHFPSVPNFGCCALVIPSRSLRSAVRAGNCELAGYVGCVLASSSRICRNLVVPYLRSSRLKAHNMAPAALASEHERGREEYLGAIIAEQVARQPQACALIYYGAAGGEALQRYTYAEVWKTAVGLARVFGERLRSAACSKKGGSPIRKGQRRRKQPMCPLSLFFFLSHHSFFVKGSRRASAGGTDAAHCPSRCSADGTGCW